MSSTPNMGLALPTVSVTTGPQWATLLNSCLTLIDSHNHASGSGVQVPTSGLNINASLGFNSNDANHLRSTQFDNQSSTLSGGGDLRCLYARGGDLFYNNSSGTPIQITQAGTINISGIPTNVWATTNVSGNVVILSSDTFVELLVDASAARNITLPVANTVTAGRFYFIKDIAGTSNQFPITLVPQASNNIDGTGAGTNVALSSAYGHWIIVSDGVSKWWLFSSAPTTLNTDGTSLLVSAPIIGDASKSDLLRFGVTTVSSTGSIQTLTAAQLTTQVVRLTGALVSSASFIAPSTTGWAKLFINNTTNANFETSTVKTAAGTGVLIPSGSGKWVISDGSNIISAGASNQIIQTYKDQSLASYGATLQSTTSTSYVDLSGHTLAVKNCQIGDLIDVTVSLNYFDVTGSANAYASLAFLDNFSTTNVGEVQNTVAVKNLRNTLQWMYTVTAINDVTVKVQFKADASTTAIIGAPFSMVVRHIRP